MGKLQLDADEELVKEMQDEKCLQKREHSQVAAPDILYGSVDAAKVRIEPRDPQEKAVKDRETWRDLKAGCWYEGEGVPARQQSVRQKDKQQCEGVVLRAKNKKYFCDIARSQRVWQVIVGHGLCSRRRPCAPAGLYLRWCRMDLEFDCSILPAGHSNCGLVSCRRPFERIAEQAFPNVEERHTWLHIVTEDLWQGQSGGRDRSVSSADEQVLLGQAISHLL